MTWEEWDTAYREGFGSSLAPGPAEVCPCLDYASAVRSVSWGCGAGAVASQWRVSGDKEVTHRAWPDQWLKLVLNSCP